MCVYKYKYKYIYIYIHVPKFSLKMALKRRNM